MLKMPPIKKFFYEVKADPFSFSLIVFGFIFLSSTKIVPLLVMHYNRVPELDQHVMPIKLIALSLFYPFQTNITEVGIRDYRFHEFGCYIGILSFLIICWSLRRKTFWVKNYKVILIVLFFFWIATGIGGNINPWTLYLEIPFIKSAHLQSRFFIIFLIFYLIILAKALDTEVNSRFILIIILSILILEFLFVKNYSTFQAFKRYARVIDYPTYITKRKITKTLGYIPQPEVYFETDKASSGCYDKAKPISHVLNVNDDNYRGEIYPLKTLGKIDLIEFSPGFIEAKYKLDVPGDLVFNTNSNGAWRANFPNEIIENEKNLLVVRVKNRNGNLILKYIPSYFKYIIILYISGIIIYIVVCRRIFFEK